MGISVAFRVSISIVSKQAWLTIYLKGTELARSGEQARETDGQTDRQIDRQTQTDRLRKIMFHNFVFVSRLKIRQ